MAQNQRFLACWVNFFAEVPLEGACWANFFAVSPRRRVVGRVLLRCCGLVRSRRHVGVAKAADLEGVPKFACNSLRASCRFVLVRDAVSLVFWNCMRNWGRARYWGEVGCWCVTFSPCSAWWWWKRYKTLPAGSKWAEKGYFGRAGRVLYRVGPTGPRAGRVLYRVIPPGLCAGRVLYRHRPRVRYKVLPAWLVIGVSVKRFSLRAESGPKSAFLCVWGEFCTGWACRGCQWGEFCTGGGFVAWR